MTTVNVYINFNGNCEEAFNFYKSVFGVEVSYVSRYNEMPQEDAQHLSESDMNKIMHISLQISKETVLMGSDVGGEWAKDFKQGNNFAVSIGTNAKDEAHRIFHALAQDGIVTMPMSNTFWGDYFGMVTDKFGIAWMMSYNENRQAK